jgi:flagellar FliL protein
LTLRIAEAKSDEQAPTKSQGADDVAKEKGEEAAVRDKVLAVLGRQTSEQLLGAGGKDKLKKELIAAVSDAPESKVLDVFFTEFLIQR